MHNNYATKNLITFLLILDWLQSHAFEKKMCWKPWSLQKKMHKENEEIHVNVKFMFLCF